MTPWRGRSGCARAASCSPAAAAPTAPRPPPGSREGRSSRTCRAAAAALTRFEGLPHRTQLVAESDGVRWVDDSKGTNVDATAKSLEGHLPGSVLLILGGRDKHGDFATLAPLVARSVRAVLTVGEAAPLIEKALAGV